MMWNMRCLRCGGLVFVWDTPSFDVIANNVTHSKHCELLLMQIRSAERGVVLFSCSAHPGVVSSFVYRSQCSYESVSKRFRTVSITNNRHSLRSNTRIMAAKLTRLTHKIAIQLYLVAESRTICSSRSRRPVRKLLDTPSCVCVCVCVCVCINK
jgi:homospermidine synthase